MGKHLNFDKMNKYVAEQLGLPTWNNCNHYVVDMSHLGSTIDGSNDKDWMNTIVIRLPNGNFATMCVMQTSEDESCIDAAFHGDNIKEKLAIGFGEGRDERMGERNIYALITRAKEVK